MLGSYSQNALSGAATVNQIFFHGSADHSWNRRGICCAGCPILGTGKDAADPQADRYRIKAWSDLWNYYNFDLYVYSASGNFYFTNDPEIIAEGVAYLGIIKYTFLLFIITNVLMAALRCVETVKISFYISIVSLIVNVGINYVLIFGRFGAPELGIRGAAIGTLVARIVELGIVVVYMLKIDKS